MLIPSVVNSHILPLNFNVFNALILRGLPCFVKCIIPILGISGNPLVFVKSAQVRAIG
jgi:hypothetical protein